MRPVNSMEVINIQKTGSFILPCVKYLKRLFSAAGARPNMKKTNKSKTNTPLYFAQHTINKREGWLGKRKMYFPSFLVRDDRPRVAARRYHHGDESPALRRFLLILVSETRVWTSWGLLSQRGLWFAPQRALQGSRLAIRCCYFNIYLSFLQLHILFIPSLPPHPSPPPRRSIHCRRNHAFLPMFISFFSLK